MQFSGVCLKIDNDALNSRINYSRVKSLFRKALRAVGYKLVRIRSLIFYSKLYGYFMRANRQDGCGFVKFIHRVEPCDNCLSNLPFEVGNALSTFARYSEFRREERSRISEGRKFALTGPLITPYELQEDTHVLPKLNLFFRSVQTRGENHNSCERGIEKVRWLGRVGREGKRCNLRRHSDFYESLCPDKSCIYYICVRETNFFLYSGKISDPYVFKFLPKRLDPKYLVRPSVHSFKALDYPITFELPRNVWQRPDLIKEELKRYAFEFLQRRPWELLHPLFGIPCAPEPTKLGKREYQGSFRKMLRRKVLGRPGPITYVPPSITIYQPTLDRIRPPTYADRPANPR